jgi:hypothetical protein
MFSAAGADYGRLVTEGETMKPSFKGVVATLLAGAIAGSMPACSKDLPTAPVEKDNAGVSLLAVPPNDDFQNAVAITGLPFTHSVNTTAATAAPDDPSGPENCDIEGHTVWYKFTATKNIRLNVFTGASSYDPGVAVFTRAGDQFTRVSCNFIPSSMTFDAVAGTTYYIMVGSTSEGTSGNLVLTADVGLKVGITIDPVGTVTRAGVVTITGTLTCSKPAFFELGAALQQGDVVISQGGLFASSNCDRRFRWEAQATGDNGQVKPGRAIVTATALLTADATTEERHAGPVTRTVRLRNARER